METIDHHGKFMEAEPVEIRVVAIIWDKLDVWHRGGEIIGAVDLGWHPTSASVSYAVTDAGFSVKRGLSIVGRGLTLSYNLDGETVTPDATIDVCK